MREQHNYSLKIELSASASKAAVTMRHMYAVGKKRYSQRVFPRRRNLFFWLKIHRAGGELGELRV